MLYVNFNIIVNGSEIKKKIDTPGLPKKFIYFHRNKTMNKYLLPKAIVQQFLSLHFGSKLYKQLRLATL